MEDFLERAISLAGNADYADVRCASLDSTSILLKDNDVEKLSTGTSSVYSIRVLNKGAWGLASSSNPSKLDDTVALALKLARSSSKLSIMSSLSEEKPAEKKFVYKPRQDARDVGLDEKVAVLRELAGEMRNKGVSSTTVGYAGSAREYYFYSTEGTRLFWSAPFTKLMFEAFAEGATLESARQATAKFAGFELAGETAALAVQVAENAARMKTASRVPSGTYDVIVDSLMGGTMSHEAVGHPCEADLVLTGESILAGKLNTKIANDCISMVDDGTLFPESGFIPFDDEGTLSQRTQLIKDGTLVGYLHSRETAAKMNVRSTGNARAEGVSFFPIVRMTNTYFEPGNHSFEELIDLKKALIIEGFNGGVVNPLTGEYQFAGQTGWLVENGEKTKFLKSISIAGNVLETLKSVDALSKSRGTHGVGLCGKSGQSVSVGDSSPWMRIHNARVLGE